MRQLLYSNKYSIIKSKCSNQLFFYQLATQLESGLMVTERAHTHTTTTLSIIT